MFTVGSTSIATWEVPELRQRLAKVFTFCRCYHRHPYCLATLQTYVGAQIGWFDEEAFTLPSYLISQPESILIKLNTLVRETIMCPLAILHECCHHILGHRRQDCTGKIESREERDVWLASTLVGVSWPLIRLVLDGHESASEIAWRCRVPEPLVMIRAGLAVVLGERAGPLSEALDLIRYQLGRLELWIERMKAWICARAQPA